MPAVIPVFQPENVATEARETPDFFAGFGRHVSVAHQSALSKSILRYRYLHGGPGHVAGQSARVHYCAQQPDYYCAERGKTMG